MKYVKHKTKNNKRLCCSPGIDIKTYAKAYASRLFKNLCSLFDSSGHGNARGSLLENGFSLIVLSTYPFCQKNRCCCSPRCCWKAGLCRNSAALKGPAEPWVRKWLFGWKPSKMRDMNLDNFKRWKGIKYASVAWCETCGFKSVL